MLGFFVVYTIRFNQSCEVLILYIVLILYFYLTFAIAIPIPLYICFSEKATYNHEIHYYTKY